MKNPWIVCALLAGSSLAQVPSHLDAVHALPTQPGGGAWQTDRVLVDSAHDGRLWARGADWKASFGAEGFTYYPFVPHAEHDLPVAFRIAGVQVGGVPVPFDKTTPPVRSADRVTFDRGAVREIYDLDLDEVEQTFVLTTGLPGDIDVLLAIDSALPRDEAMPGLQFGSGGVVRYGEAFVVRDSERHAIGATWDNGALRLHVPATLRGDGPVVIDPILTTQGSSAIGAVSAPDVSWDEANERYLVVWQYEFSTTDHDIVCEFFDAAGNRISQTSAAIDVSGTDWIRPRVANIRSSQSYLIAAEVADPNYGGRHMIYFRTRSAYGATSVQSAMLLSDPLFPGNNFVPSVGGDPRAGGTTHHWLVAWTNDAANDYNALARTIDEGGNPSSGLLFVADGVHQLNSNVQLSRSNGNGLVPQPGWFAVYSRFESTGGWNVYGRRIGVTGQLGLEIPLDTTTGDDLYPRPSSPILTADGKTQYLITYERQNPPEAHAVVATLSPGLDTYVRRNLTVDHGLDPYWVRAESDGSRYAVTAGTASNVRVCTLASTGSTLAVQDGPHELLGSLTVNAPEITSRRGSGGEAGEYGIVCLKTAGTPRVQMIRYAGQQGGATTTVLPTACDGLQLAHAGSSVLGATMHFQLAGFGAGLPLFAFGTPIDVPVPLCANCLLGVRADLPIATVFGTTCSLQIPPRADLVGATFAVQGLAFGTGSCIGALAFTDTVVATIR